jgi:hypothetical protein
VLETESDRGVWSMAASVWGGVYREVLERLKVWIERRRGEWYRER